MKATSNLSHKGYNLSQGFRTAIRITVLLFVSFIFSAKEASSQNYVVNYSVPNLNPQSIVYYADKKKFIISSEKQGQLGYIDDNGNYKLLIKDALLKGASRMLVKDNLLYVLTYSSNSTDSKALIQSYIVKVDLKNKAIVSATRFGKLHAPSTGVSTDLAIDDVGTIYIVDGFSPVLHQIKIDGTTTELLIKRLSGKVKSVVYHKNGYLLVAVDQDLYKINLLNNNVTEVFLEETFNEINSLHFSPNHLLILTEGGDVNKMHILNSSNSWTSANLLRTDTTSYIHPNGIEYVNNKIYILDSEIQHLSDSVLKSGDFSVHVIDLQKKLRNKRRKGTITVGGLETRIKK